MIVWLRQPVADRTMAYARGWACVMAAVAVAVLLVAMLARG